ncbi:hypothetical protein [Bernardetia sp. MNP-M8]|uniref:hypothetical protein n=1 Tax=Bernardetia sp. MNP-M8 TaxID=3127470 RepID=UPI0030D2BE81
MFDFTGHSKRLQELEIRNEKLLDKVKILENSLDNVQQNLDKKPEDYENNIRYDSKMITQYKNKINKNAKDIEKNITEIEFTLQNILTSKQTANETVQDINAIEENIIAKNNKIVETFEDFNSKNEELKKHLSNFDTIISENPNFKDDFKHMMEVIENSKEEANKIIAIHKSALTKKSEVDKLYNSIVGYEEEDENGNVVLVEGLKDKLKKQYNHLNKEISELNSIVNTVREENAKENIKLFNSNKKRLDNTIEEWNLSYELIEKKINNLLPRALTTGLSYAYSDKKKEEEVLFDKSSRLFNKSIIGLVGVSLIPFFISLYFLFNGYLLDEIIQKMPRLVLTILPLYLPVLWLAYSANKRINLSKRLIEEYAHKEVLSKTYEGLSRQVNDIDSEDFSEELKVKLLSNLLQISSENPGKLISNYEKSDHPIMDVLEKSMGLDKAVDKLSKSDSIDKVRELLENKRKNKIQETLVTIEEKNTNE